MSDQNTLRDMLDASFAASDSGTLGQVADAPTIAVAEPSPQETTEQAAQRARDDLGRFSAKTTPEESVPPAVAAPVAAAEPVAAQPPAEAPQVPRPTTWKKEYLPMWDKLNSGQALTPEESRKLADYSQQREKEYATGVSTYRAEALAAKELQSAVEPFIPTLQQHNMPVKDWINMLGTAHKTLALGTPEQKLQMFANMAHQYGVPLQAVTQMAQGGQVDPMVGQLMQQLQDMNTKVSSVVGWREQQEQQNLQRELSEFSDASKYPHFEMVRGDMAQLLESGLAPDLKTAYAKAVRFNDEAWQAEQERQAPASIAPITPQPSKADAAAKAKAAAVSPKSVTPSGTAKTVNAEDLRAQLEAGFDSMASARL
jgi:hypothetical protein